MGAIDEGYTLTFRKISSFSCTYVYFPVIGFYYTTKDIHSSIEFFSHKLVIDDISLELENPYFFSVYLRQ